MFKALNNAMRKIDPDFAKHFILSMLSKLYGIVTKGKETESNKMI